ncbi:MAG: hypothetical protein H0W58_07290 [Acidobacteria bacterium]|nr:hypothetical protein [Acidobacteriota bacterium]
MKRLAASVRKRFFLDNGMPNNSMDVRAKQRLSFHVVRQTQSCVYSVLPHVNSTVMPLK